MKRSVSVISSMATRHILSELVRNFEVSFDCSVALTSIGGVDAARRLAAGEAFDLVVLARDALGKLARDGHVMADSMVDFAKSPAAIAVHESAECPAICDEAAIRDTLRAAGIVGVSTGPSGKAVRTLLREWGFVEPQLTIVEAPPGMPVARLVAARAVDIGFQQMSELLGEPGINIFGPIPDHVLPMTTFAMAACRNGANPADAAALLRYLSSAEASSAKSRGGMQP